MIKATIERLERVLQIAAEEGIEVRREWLRGVRGGLVRVRHTPILFVDDSLSAAEQWEQTRSALNQLDWSGTESADEMLALLQVTDIVEESYL